MSFPTVQPFLKSDRLELRQLVLEDAPTVLFLRSDPQVNQYIQRDPLQNMEDAEAFINKILRLFKEKKSLFWAICLKESHEMIGSICLWNFSEDYKKTEVGYDLNPAHHGKGIMSEALQAIIKYGFNTLQVTSIEAYTERENVGSQRLLKKNQFVLLSERKDEGNANNDIFELKKEK